jgi:hypothetical protein
MQIGIIYWIRKEVRILSTTLVYGTVIVVLAIFAVFFFFAQRADKLVAEKAAAKRLEMPKAAAKVKKK